MGRESFGDFGWYQDYDIIDAADFDGGQAVDTLLDSFVDKYRALAVSAGVDGWKAVPSKLILYRENEDVRVSNNYDEPFTMIVDRGDLIIEEDIDVNGMFIVKDGRIIFESEDCNDRQSAKGIFITYGDGGFGKLGAAAYNTFSNIDQERCREGGLTVK
jgi:hypothetical protein